MFTVSLKNVTEGMVLDFESLTGYVADKLVYVGEAEVISVVPEAGFWVSPEDMTTGTPEVFVPIIRSNAEFRIAG